MLRAIAQCDEEAVVAACGRAHRRAKAEHERPGMPGTVFEGASVTPGTAILDALKDELRALLTVH